MVWHKLNANETRLFVMVQACVVATLEVNGIDKTDENAHIIVASLIDLAVSIGKAHNISLEDLLGGVQKTHEGVPEEFKAANAPGGVS